MPNHVRNVWKLSNITPDKINYILNKLTRTTKEGNRIIDFDLIIPEPRLKKDCPKDSIRKPKSCSQLDETRPWFDWYEFHINHWGTKWGAYDGYTKTGKTYITMIFSTAWSFAYPITTEIIKLCRENNLNCELKYADEDLGHNCGKVVYNYKTNDLTHYREDELDVKDVVKWAKKLWYNYG